MNFVLSMLVAFLCAFGFISLLYYLTELLFTQRDYETFILIPVSEGDEDLEFKLFQAKAQLRRLRDSANVRIIILDNGMSELMRALAQKEAQRSENVLICRVNELQKVTRYSKM